MSLRQTKLFITINPSSNLKSLVFQAPGAISKREVEQLTRKQSYGIKKACFEIIKQIACFKSVTDFN